METKQTQTLQGFIRELIQPEAVPATKAHKRDGETIYMPPEETGIVAKINEETWDWFLDVLHPHYMQAGLFCFAEGFTPLSVFFRRSGRYFVRTLTWDETRKFCRLAGVPMPGFG